MFDFTDASVTGGLCLASQNIADDNENKWSISDTDVVSLYPYIMTQNCQFQIIDSFQIQILIKQIWSKYGSFLPNECRNIHNKKGFK